MGSGLILLLIVGAWLAVLVPMALRSHEAASVLGTVDKFSDAMRVLSRRGHARAGQASGSPAPAPVQPERPSEPERPSRPGPSPAARRRRALCVLVLVAGVTLVGGLLGPVWLFVPHLVADLLLVAFLGWSRNQAVVRAEREWRAAMGGRRSSVSDEAWSPLQEWSDEPAGAPHVPAQAGSADDRLAADPYPQDVFDQETLEPVWEAAPPVALGRLTAVPVPEQAPARGAQGEPWQPVPVPVPTYVTAPRAPRRVVDLNAPRSTAQAQTSGPASAERSLASGDQGPELEHVLGRRAVGG